jgi:chromosome segregation ATPase
MNVVEVISVMGGAIATWAGGPPTVKYIIGKFFRKSEKENEAALAAAAQAVKEREVTARHRLDLDFQLKGTTQEQVEELQKWMRLQLEKLQSINDERGAIIARQEAEIQYLRARITEIEKQREQVKQERDELESRCLLIIERGKALADRLEAKDIEVSRMQLRIIELEGKIAALTTQLEAAITALARVEDENTYLRARGRTEQM